MEYKLCNDNMICCSTDCMRCANLVHDALTNENKILKKELDKRNKEKDGFFNEIKRITEERNRIHDELEQANEDIESLNNKNWDYGFQIMSKDRKIMELEEKCAKLEKENNYLDQECESLLARFSERIAELEKENLFLKRSGNIATIEKKLQELTEDIIRLDKCLSRRPCVKMEREEED